MNCKNINLRTLLLAAPFSLLFLLGLHEQLAVQAFDRIALLSGAALTAMIAFTGLLYNRARAWPNGPMQRRCLYAAENCFQGAVFFILGCLLSVFVILGLAFFTGSGLKVLKGTDLLLAMITPVIFVLLSFYRVLYGLRVAYVREPAKLLPKVFLRRLK